jgi:hypothetical protein
MNGACIETTPDHARTYLGIRGEIRGTTLGAGRVGRSQTVSTPA